MHSVIVIEFYDQWISLTHYMLFTKGKSANLKPIYATCEQVKWFKALICIDLHKSAIFCFQNAVSTNKKNNNNNNTNRPLAPVCTYDKSRGTAAKNSRLPSAENAVSTFILWHSIEKKKWHLIFLYWNCDYFAIGSLIFIVERESSAHFLFTFYGLEIDWKDMSRIGFCVAAAAAAAPWAQFR